MGGTSACCVEREPQNESILKKEASKTKEELTRTSVKYKYIDTEQDNEEINKIINSSIDIPDTTQTKKRGSIIRIEPNKNETEDKKDEDLYDIKQNNSSSNPNEDEYENRKLSHDRASRASYDSEDELPSSKYSKTKTRHNHKSSHSHHHKKKHKKSKNKLVSSLRDCIEEFNKSMQSISVLQLMSGPTINAATSTYDQNELLDKKEIPKYFKEKKYDIQWFLLTKRNKFIKIMVNKWPNNISILTSIKLYDMLQEKISKHTPSVSQSSLNVVSTPYNHYKSKNLNSNKRRKSGHHQENIMFTWRDDVNEIDDCDVNHFLYIASLAIKNLNQEIMKTNAHSTQTMHKRRPLYHQMDILTYLKDIEMDGYLFRGCSKQVFQINISRFMIDTDTLNQIDINTNHDNNDNDYYLNNLSMEYSAIFHAKCDQFEISKIYKQSTCTIEFTLSNSKRWESVSSLIKTMQVSEYNVDLAIDNSSSDGDGEDDSSDDHDIDDNYNEQNDDDDEKQREPDLKLKGSMNISAQMEKLREMKDTMDTNEYISKMETLQQKLAQSLALK